MNLFELTILGSNSALPAYGRYPTCQVLNVGHSSYMIDCGEGAQMRLTQYKIKRNKISHIFISHLHGDHLYGLPGVITSMNHSSRKLPLHLYGPKGLKKYIDVLIEIGEVHLNFELHIQEINKAQTLLDNDLMQIEAFEVYHRIPTFGFLFKEKLGEKNILKEAISQYNLSIDEIINIKQGADLVRNNETVSNQILTKPAHKPRSYAYCADSKADDKLIQVIQGVDLLYFETTYLDDMKQQAFERGHATAKEAALLAKKARVGQLVTGHYSSRYKDVEPLYKEAKSIFENVIMGYDGAMITL